MKLFFTVILSCFLLFSASGQNIHIYQINLNGTKGKLIRMESYSSNNLREVSQYDENEKLTFVLSKRYNNKKQLIKEVKTFKKEHEYDLITEYYYDSEGRKSGILKGNNRYGKWSSERYIYNTNNDLDSVFFYEKNGDLTRMLIHQYEYDAQKKKTKLVRKNMDVEMDEEISRSNFQYEYDGSGFNEKITEKDKEGIIIYQEWRKSTSSGLPLSITYKMQDFPEFKTEYTYNSNKRLSKKVEYSDGKLSATTYYKYNSKGKLIQEKSSTTSGYYGEIYVH